MSVYVITGANRGLGLEFVRELSSNARNIIIAAVRTTVPAPPALASLAKDSAATIHILQCDTGSASSIKEFGTAVTSLLGSEKIDYLINNAGVLTDPRPNSLGIDSETVTLHMNVNVVGPALVVVALLPHLRRGSYVVNISSALGSISRAKTTPPGDTTVYSLSKAALNMLSVHQAADLKEKGVVVVALEPGWARTDMGGKSATMEPAESVNLMLRVVHDLNEESSGKFYSLDGTEHAW